MKDFDRWNTIKKEIDGYAEEMRPYFRAGEIWWVRLGVNVGYEIDGKREGFLRPAIVLKKYNQYSFLAVPLTTSAKPNPYRLPIGILNGRQAFAMLSQLRNIDSKRLVEKIAFIEGDPFDVIKKEASRATVSRIPTAVGTCLGTKLRP